MAGKAPECWFAQQLSNFGEDYISGGKMNEIKVKRNIDRIISDIINGRIDYNLYGYCILYPPVFDTLTAYCNDQIVVKQAIDYSLNYTMMQVGIGNIRCDRGVQSDLIADGNTPEYWSSYGLAPVNMITEGTRRNIMVANEENKLELSKYMCISYYLSRVSMTQNVFELMNVPNILKQSMRRK